MLAATSQQGYCERLRENTYIVVPLLIPSIHISSFAPHSGFGSLQQADWPQARYACGWLQVDKAKSYRLGRRRWCINSKTRSC